MSCDAVRWPERFPMQVSDRAARYRLAVNAPMPDESDVQQGAH